MWPFTKRETEAQRQARELEARAQCWAATRGACLVSIMTRKDLDEFRQNVVYSFVELEPELQQALRTHYCLQTLCAAFRAQEEKIEQLNRKLELQQQRYKDCQLEALLDENFK